MTSGQCVKGGSLAGLFVVFIQVLGAQGLPLPVSSQWGSNALSLGGAQAAAANSWDSTLTNPAGLIYYFQGKGMGASYSGLPKYSSSTKNRTRWSLGLVDGTQGVVGGLQFASFDWGGFRQQQYALATAYRLYSISFGAAVQVIRFSGIRPGKGWHFTGSAGVLIPVALGFSIGAYTHSFIDREDDHLLPPSLHLGALYQYGSIGRFTFDSDRRFQVPGQDWNYSAGADIFIWEQFVSAKGGYRKDQTKNEKDSFWSSGLTLNSPRFQISGLYIRRIGSPGGNGMAFDLSARF